MQLHLQQLVTIVVANRRFYLHMQPTRSDAGYKAIDTRAILRSVTLPSGTGLPLAVAILSGLFVLG